MTRPTVVTLCGSTRFLKLFQEARLLETLAGRIVLTIGCDMPTDEVFSKLTPDELEKVKEQFDRLHKAKIDLSDEILVLDGTLPYCKKHDAWVFEGKCTTLCRPNIIQHEYIGPSTRSEIDHAVATGKRVRYWSD